MSVQLRKSETILSLFPVIIPISYLFFRRDNSTIQRALAVLQNKNQSDVLELKKLKEENQVLRNENED